jgi:dynein intermediate chain
MADRKAELERKKQRLAQMREEKERRRKEKERLDAENAAQSLLGSRAGSSSPSRTCNLIYVL